MNTTTRKILVVDDERVIRDMMVDLLEIEGYDIELAKHGQEALDLLEAAGSETRYLMFLDLMMPVMDGKKLCTRLNQDPKLRQRLVIVAMSALDLLTQSTALYVDEIMPKPFVIEKVLAIIQKYVDA